jgi:hypothetical protein
MRTTISPTELDGDRVTAGLLRIDVAGDRTRSPDAVYFRWRDFELSALEEEAVRFGMR